MSDPQLTAPNEGLSDQLAYILSAPISGVLAWYLMLWTNDDLVISQTTVFADLDEATFNGYGRVTLSRVNWTTPVIEDDRAVSTYTLDPIIWTNSGSPATVYGWAIITPTPSVIRYIQPFPDPQELDTGDPVGVLPRIALTTLPDVSMLGKKKALPRRPFPTIRR